MARDAGEEGFFDSKEVMLPPSSVASPVSSGRLDGEGDEEWLCVGALLEPRSRPDPREEEIIVLGSPDTESDSPASRPSHEADEREDVGAPG
ncbi:hypothetical protein ZWY2020_007643 [Hordeum vulgare]|nr:hypothetical protein ZWY2020_007643 [Hordeum vulgare]